MENSRNENEGQLNRTSERRVLTGMFRDRESTENAYNSCMIEVTLKMILTL